MDRRDEPRSQNQKVSTMGYRIADMVNGPFSEVVETMTEAEKLLKECIEEGQKVNDEETPEGYEVPDAASFFCIVDAETGEEV